MRPHSLGRSLLNSWENLSDSAVGRFQQSRDRLGARQNGEQPIDERWASESRLSTPAEPRLLWFGGVIVVVLLVVGFAILANPLGWLNVGLPTPALATEQGATPSTLGERSTCAEFHGGGELLSPEEGVWFQGHCVSTVALVDGVAPSCRRTSTDVPEFTQISPDLYVFRQGQGSAAFLWHASAEACLDLVSSQIVTAICADRAVTFGWDERSACSSHGGVIAWVNGP